MSNLRIRAFAIFLNQVLEFLRIWFLVCFWHSGRPWLCALVGWMLCPQLYTSIVGVLLEVWLCERGEQVISIGRYAYRIVFFFVERGLFHRLLSSAIIITVLSRRETKRPSLGLLVFDIMEKRKQSTISEKSDKTTKYRFCGFWLLWFFFKSLYLSSQNQCTVSLFHYLNVLFCYLWDVYDSNLISPPWCYW